MPQNPSARKIDVTALVVAVLLLGCSAIVAFDASRQTIVSTYGVGPTAMPYVVATGLAILGLAHVVVAFKDGLPKPDAADSGAVLWIVAGLVGLVACIALDIGFIIATGIVFACTARGMGRRDFLVDLLIGLVLGSAIYLLFLKLLTLSLPAGPLERLLS